MLSLQKTLTILGSFASIVALPAVASAQTLLDLPSFEPGKILVGPTSVTTTMGTNAGSVSQLIDQSGLSTPQAPYSSCATNFLSFMDGTTHSSPPADFGWRSSSATGFVTFGMDCQPKPIVGIGLWQSTFASGASTQLKDFDLWADVDGDVNNGLGTLIGSFTANQTSNLHPGQVGHFGPHKTPFIHLEVLSNYGNASTTTLGEVVFATVPEPMTMLGAGVAAGLGAVFKRRSSKKA